MRCKWENVLHKFLLQTRKTRIILEKSVITQLAMENSAIEQTRAVLPAQRGNNIQTKEKKNHKTLKGKNSFLILNIWVYVLKLKRKQEL